MMQIDTLPDWRATGQGVIEGVHPEHVRTGLVEVNRKPVRRRGAGAAEDIAEEKLQFADGDDDGETPPASPPRSPFAKGSGSAAGGGADLEVALFS